MSVPERIVEESENSTASSSDAAYVWSFLSNALPILAIVFATATLYRGRDVFLPIAMALVLAIIFKPIASRLELYVGRILSASLVVLFAIGAVAAIGYFLTVELTDVADMVSGYSDNIGNKLGALAKASPPWLQHLQYALSDIQHRVHKDTPAPISRHVIQATPMPGTMLDDLPPVLPVVDGVVEGLLVIVLMFFLLYSRRDLRDRMVRLVARARITIAPQAVETAAQTVGHYLLLFSLTNLSFGLVCGLTAWFLGLPNAPLFGVLAFLLRFIPYVGALTAAVLPTLVAFALFPGWAKSFEVIGAFILFDQIASQFVEPFVVGRGIDVSPVALLVSAMYWSWLWGLPGLLLATPLTACLKIAGDYIPAVGFLSVILGADRKLKDYHDFYRMLLEQDPTGARDLAFRFCDEHGLEQTFDEVLVPVLSLAGDERDANHIGEETLLFLIETIRELIEDLGNRYVPQRQPDCLRVLGVCAPGEVHNLGLLMVIELLRHTGAATKLADDITSPGELRTVVRKFAPHLVCYSCTTTECLPNAREAVAALRRDFPKLTIFAGGRAALWEASRMLEAGCDQVCGSKEEARHALRQFTLARARSLSSGQRTALQA